MIPTIIVRTALAAVMWNVVAAVTPEIIYNFENKGCFSRLNGFQREGMSPLMTPGSCGFSCKNQNKPVFALSGQTCYCGTEIPPSVVNSNSDSCKRTCNVDANNFCGADGVFIVYLVDGKSAATANAENYESSSASASVTISSSSDSKIATSTKTVITAPTTSSSDNSKTSSTSSKSTSATSTSSSSSDSSTSSVSSPPTITGTVKNSKDSKSRLSGGAIAGIVIGVVVGILVISAIIAGLVIWKKKQEDYYSPNSSPTGFKNDFGSFSGLYPPQPPRPVDPRLNPAMLGDPRISIASLADARDYSRQVLTVANPDMKV